MRWQFSGSLWSAIQHALSIFSRQLVSNTDEQGRPVVRVVWDHNMTTIWPRHSQRMLTCSGQTKWAFSSFCRPTLQMWTAAPIDGLLAVAGGRAWPFARPLRFSFPLKVLKCSLWAHCPMDWSFNVQLLKLVWLADFQLTFTFSDSQTLLSLTDTFSEARRCCTGFRVHVDKKIAGKFDKFARSFPKVDLFPIATLRLWSAKCLRIEKNWSSCETCTVKFTLWMPADALVVLA